MKEREFAGMLYDAIRNRDLQDAVITVCASFVTSLLVSVILALPAAAVTWFVWVLGGDAGLFRDRDYYSFYTERWADKLAGIER